jgi:hypothetical protein
VKPPLSIEALLTEAESFCKSESIIRNTEIFDKHDGKSVGTYVEHKFQNQLANKFNFEVGSSANGIDLPGPDVNTDIKVTSSRQPQSSCPYRSSKQKIFGLGYNVLVFVYDKVVYNDDAYIHLQFVNCKFIHKSRTGDFTTTKRLREMIDDGANHADIMGYLFDKNIPGDEVTLSSIADQILQTPPEQGYLTISNALQWRLQYQRVVSLDEDIEGIIKIIH